MSKAMKMYSKQRKEVIINRIYYSMCRDFLDELDIATYPIRIKYKKDKKNNDLNRISLARVAVHQLINADNIIISCNVEKIHIFPNNIFEYAKGLFKDLVTESIFYDIIHISLLHEIYHVKQYNREILRFIGKSIDEIKSIEFDAALENECQDYVYEYIKRTYPNDEQFLLLNEIQNYDRNRECVIVLSEEEAELQRKKLRNAILNAKEYLIEKKRV